MAPRRHPDDVALEHYREAARKWLREQPITDPDRLKQAATDGRLLVEAYDIIEVLLWDSEMRAEEKRVLAEKDAELRRAYAGWQEALRASQLDDRR